jgi:hypothetical protein
MVVTGDVMRELLTKSFWLGVKKTYDEALEGPPPEASAAQALLPDGPNPSSEPETTPPAPSSSSPAD